MEIQSCGTAQDCSYNINTPQHLVDSYTFSITIKSMLDTQGQLQQVTDGEGERLTKGFYPLITHWDWEGPGSLPVKHP